MYLKVQQSSTNLVNRILIVILISTATLIGQNLAAARNDSRQNPNSRPNNNNKNSTTTFFCDKDLAKAIDKCAKPLMDVLEGRVERWPVNSKEALDLCNDFVKAERCIKDTGRKCANGLQKTIISAFASSLSRARKQECQEEKLNNILRMTQCVHRNQLQIQTLVLNATVRLETIDTRIREPSEKISGLCCMIVSVQDKLKSLLHPKCPIEADTIDRLFKGVVADATDLMCRTSQKQCLDLYDKLDQLVAPKLATIVNPNRRNKKIKDSGVIYRIMRIFESISDV